MSVTREQRWHCHGFPVERGTEVTIRGEPGGRYQFLAYCTNDDGRVWIDCYGGRRGRECFRSFDPDRVAVIHRTRRMRTP